METLHGIEQPTTLGKGLRSATGDITSSQHFDCEIVMWFDKPSRNSFLYLKINRLLVLKNTKNYVKQRMFLGNTLTREAGLTLLTTNGIVLLYFSSDGHAQKKKNRFNPLPTITPLIVESKLQQTRKK